MSPPQRRDTELSSPPAGLNSSVPDLAPSSPAANGVTGPTSDYNQTSTNETGGTRGSLVGTGTAGQAQSYRHKHTSQALEKQPALEMAGGEKSSMPYRPPRRGPQNVHQHFDINEHLPWMIVLFLLLVLVVIVVCSVRKSSRTLKKGPRQDPSAIVEKAIMKKSTTPTQNREKWIYYCNGHGEQYRPGAGAAGLGSGVLSPFRSRGALDGPPHGWVAFLAH